MLRSRAAAIFMSAALLGSSGLMISCDKEDEKDVEEGVEDVDKGVDKLDEDGKDD